VARSTVLVHAGFESRQFLHADDAAAALGTMMQNYGSLEVAGLSVGARARRAVFLLSALIIAAQRMLWSADPLAPLGRGVHDCPALTARPQRAAAHRSALPADVQPITDISSGDWTSLRELAAILQEQLPSPCVIGFNESNVLLSPVHCASRCRALPCSERFDDPPLAALGTHCQTSDALALQLLQRVGRRRAYLHSCAAWSPLH
jgi:hypothetical protein